MNSYAKNIAERVASGELQIITEFKGEFNWLSNFYWHYSDELTAEHYFQAAKVERTPGFPMGVHHPKENIGWATVIYNAPTPGKAKRLGRQCPLRVDWEEVKDSMMESVLWNKYINPTLNQWLLATGDIPLEEGNYWHDNYWGNCLCDKCKDLPGLNKLGKMLMALRTRLRGSAWDYTKTEKRRHRDV